MHAIAQAVKTRCIIQLVCPLVGLLVRLPATCAVLVVVLSFISKHLDKCIWSTLSTFNKYVWST